MVVHELDLEVLISGDIVKLLQPLPFGFGIDKLILLISMESLVVEYWISLEVKSA